MYNQLLNMTQHNDGPFLVGTDSYYLLACHWEGTVARFSFSLSTLEGQIVQIKLAKNGLTHNNDCLGFLMDKITTPHGVVLECALVICIIGYISKAATLSMEKLKVNVRYYSMNMPGINKND